MDKFNLRIPVELFEEVRQEAAALHVSMNTYVLQALTNYIPFTREIRQRREHKASTAATPPASAKATQRLVPKVGANQPCPCGSGRKYRQCHGA